MTEVRPPAVAGSFYPGAADRLAAVVDALLERARPGASAPKALVVPHAGYVYSGPIAATAYAQLAARARRIDRVILLGPSHYVPFHGLAHCGADAWATPLGQVPVGGTASLSGVVPLPAAHEREHSLEVQLPFLQRLLGRFELVPLVVGRARPEQVAEVLERLWGGDETLVLVSSDLSHYLPYHEARTADARTARRIEALEPDLEPFDACGAAPLNGLLHLARHRGLRAEALDLRTSGDTASDKSRVVGYGAFAFRETPA